MLPLSSHTLGKTALRTVYSDSIIWFPTYDILSFIVLYNPWRKRPTSWTTFLSLASHSIWVGLSLLTVFAEPESLCLLPNNAEPCILRRVIAYQNFLNVPTTYCLLTSTITVLSAIRQTTQSQILCIFSVYTSDRMLNRKKLWSKVTIYCTTVTTN